MAQTLLSNLSPELIDLCESYHCTKLTTKLKHLTKQSSKENGIRSLLVSARGAKLSGFEFNNKAPFKKTLKAKYHVKQGSRRGQVILHFPSFIPDVALNRSEEATNFKISARLISLTDMDYNQSLEKYRSVNPDINGLKGSFDSHMLPILKMPTDPITGQLSIDPQWVSVQAGLFLLLSVRFYKYDKGRFIHLADEGSMQIKAVY